MTYNITSFSIPQENINNLWKNLPFDKTDIEHFCNFVEFKTNAQEHYKADAQAEYFYTSMSAIDEKMSLAQFSEECHKNPFLRTLTYLDPEIIASAYHVYQKGFSQHSYTHIFYLLENLNESQDTFYLRDNLKYSTKLLAQSFFDKPETIVWTTNPDIIRQAFPDATEILTTPAEKEKFFLNNNIDILMNTRKEIIDKASAIPQAPRLTSKIKDTTNLFLMFEKADTDKEFILEFINILSLCPDQVHLNSSNFKAYDKYIELMSAHLNLDRAQFILEHNSKTGSFVDNILYNLTTIASPTLFKDEEIFEALCSLAGRTSAMNAFEAHPHNVDIKPYLFRHFAAMENATQKDGVEYIDYIFANKITAKPSPKLEKLIMIQSMTDIGYLSLAQEILPFYSNVLESKSFKKAFDDLSDIVKPIATKLRQKAEKSWSNYQLHTTGLKNNDTSSAELLSHVLMYPLLNKEERARNAYTFAIAANHLESLNYSPKHWVDFKQFQRNIFRNMIVFAPREALFKNKHNLLELYHPMKSYSHNPDYKFANENGSSTGIGYTLHALSQQFFTEECANLLTNKDISALDYKFFLKCFKGTPAIGAYKTVEQLKNHANDTSTPIEIQGFLSYMSQLPQITSLAQNPETFRDIFLNIIQYKEQNLTDSETLNKDITLFCTNMSVLVSHIYKHVHMDNVDSPSINQLLAIDKNNFASFFKAFGRPMALELVTIEVLQSLNHSNSDDFEVFKSLFGTVSIVNFANANFDKLSNLKPFFMDDNVLSNKMIVPSPNSPVTSQNFYLGNIYQKNDIKELFERYGNNYDWIGISPFNFVAKAPFNIKTNPNFWAYVIDKQSNKASILNYMPQNISNNPDVLEAMTKKTKKSAQELHRHFNNEINSKVNMVIETLDKSPNNLRSVSEFAYSTIMQNIPSGTNINHANTYIQETLMKAIAPPPTVANAKVKKF